MHPKTMKQQNTQHDSNQQATSVRKRAQTRASVATEYQERFLPPCCYKAVVSTSTQIDPYHPLKGTGADMTSFRSYFVARKWIKNPQKIQVPQPPVPPKGHRRCYSAPHNPVCFAANQNASTVEDYTSVYKNDFRAWKANKRQPYKVHDNLKVNQGLVVTNSASKEGRCQKNSVPVAANSPQVQEPLPFGSITSYRSDYITHPVQPRIRRDKPVYQTNKEKAQCSPENEASSGFECISTETEDSRMYWATSLDRGVTWPDEGICEEPSPAHQIISCMVSSRS